MTFFSRRLLVLPYRPNQTLFEQTSGSGSIYLADGIYEVTIVGAGGAHNSQDSTFGWIYLMGGGSGAGFLGNIRIPRGTYTYSVGGAVGTGSYLSGIISAGAGGQGWAQWTGAAWNVYGGAGGILSISGTIIGTPTIQSNGASGGTGSFQTGVYAGQADGGGSVCLGYGHGTGVANNAFYESWTYGYTGGYLKIVYKGAY